MYYIYHIPGIKVGCTDNLQRRTSANKAKYGKNIEVVVLRTEIKITKADSFEAYYHSKLGYGIMPLSQRYILRSRVGKQSTGRIHSEKSKEKMSIAKKGKIISEDSRIKMSVAKKNKYLGIKHNRYNTGAQYIELSTGTKGSMCDMVRHFNLSYNTYIYSSVQTGKPISKGRYKGLHFQIYQK